MTTMLTIDPHMLWMPLASLADFTPIAEAGEVISGTSVLAAAVVWALVGLMQDLTRPSWWSAGYWPVDATQRTRSVIAIRAGEYGALFGAALLATALFGL
jgi:hypothetical protein